MVNDQTYHLANFIVYLRCLRILLPLKSPEEWFNHVTSLSWWKCSLLIFPTSIQIALSFYVSSTVLRQNRNTDFLRYIYIFFFCCWWCQTCFLVYFFPLPFKILIIYIKKTVSCCLQTVATQKFLPFQSSDFVNISFETHPQVWSSAMLMQR